MQRKVYLIGLDGMTYPMYHHFPKGGILPTLTHMSKNDMVTDLYSSLPAYKPTKWVTMMTGTHSILRWSVDLPELKKFWKEQWK